MEKKAQLFNSRVALSYLPCKLYYFFPGMLLIPKLRKAKPWPRSLSLAVQGALLETTVKGGCKVNERESGMVSALGIRNQLQMCSRRKTEAGNEWSREALCGRLFQAFTQHTGDTHATRPCSWGQLEPLGLFQVQSVGRGKKAYWSWNWSPKL